MNDLPKAMPPPSAPIMIPTENVVVVEDTNTNTDDVRMDHTQTHTAERITPTGVYARSR